MRLLHVSDTHLGAELQVYGHPRGWRRARDHTRALHLALAPVWRGEVDAVVHSGDLFDRSSPPADAVASARLLLADAGRRVPVVIVAGNHDRHGIQRHFSSPPAGVHLVDEPERVAVAGLMLGFIPHRREAAEWAADAARLAARGVDALVVHQSFHGSRVPGYTFRAGSPPETVGGEGLPRGVRHILSGHIHPRQVVRLGEAVIVHPGSTERTSFREGDAPKGYALWEFGASVRWRFVDLPARPWVAVADRRDLAGVCAGALVRVDREGAPELARAVLARAGWLVGQRPAPAPSAQIGLFDAPDASGAPPERS